jgi:hypothetical protein
MARRRSYGDGVMSGYKWTVQDTSNDRNGERIAVFLQLSILKTQAHAISDREVQDSYSTQRIVECRTIDCRFLWSADEFA